MRPLFSAFPTDVVNLSSSTAVFVIASPLLRHTTTLEPIALASVPFVASPPLYNPLLDFSCRLPPASYDRLHPPLSSVPPCTRNLKES